MKAMSKKTKKGVSKPKARLSVPPPPLTPVQILTQALTLWLMDMASLPSSYTNTPEFRKVFKQYYLKFIHQIRVTQMGGNNTINGRG